MYTLEIIDTKHKGEKITVAVRLYNKFENAFSDIISGEGDIDGILRSYGKPIDDFSKPSQISFASDKDDGHHDDYVFTYANGIKMVLGESYIVDDCNPLTCEPVNTERKN